MTVMDQNTARRDDMWADRRTPYERSSAARSVQPSDHRDTSFQGRSHGFREMRGNALRSCLGQTASGFPLRILPVIGDHGHSVPKDYYDVFNSIPLKEKSLKRYRSVAVNKVTRR